MTKNILHAAGIDKSKNELSKITANALFNFMREYSYLENILLNMYICPRYYPEEVEYLDLKYNSEPLTEWYIPMTCFCDIPLHQISYHAEGNPLDPISQRIWYKERYSTYPLFKREFS